MTVSQGEPLVRTTIGRTGRPSRSTGGSLVDRAVTSGWPGLSRPDHSDDPSAEARGADPRAVYVMDSHRSAAAHDTPAWDVDRVGHRDGSRAMAGTGIGASHCQRSRAVS